MPHSPRPSMAGVSPRRKALRSIPAEKVPPAPVRTPTRRSSEPSSSSTAAATPSATARSRAFFASGRLIVTTRTPSRRSTSTSSATGPPRGFIPPRRPRRPPGAPPPRRRRSPSPTTPRGCRRPAAARRRRTAPGVRENRGAGPGSAVPSCSTNVPRAARCGWAGASPRPSTGVTQASVPSKAAAHSSRVRLRERLGEPAAVLGPVRDVVLRARQGVGEPEPLEEGRVELRLQRADRDVAAVGAGVGVVEGRPAVEQVGRRAGPARARRRACP